MEKRRFYNTNDAKGFTKQKFFEAVLALANGEDVSAIENASVDLVAQAATYELEGIANRASTATTGEKKDAMQSDYAIGLAAAIVPLLTDKPQTAKQLIDAATAKGKVAPSGKNWAAPWVSRVLNAKFHAGEGVKVLDVIVDHVDAKGLKSQKQVKAYAKG